MVFSAVSTWEGSCCSQPGGKVYLEGHEDLVSRLISGIIGVTIWLIVVISILT